MQECVIMEKKSKYADKELSEIPSVKYHRIKTKVILPKMKIVQKQRVTKYRIHRHSRVYVIDNALRMSKTMFDECALTHVNEVDWIASNPNEIKKYEGKYVAISENKIIGYGSTSSEAYKRAKEKDPSCEPLIMLNSSSDFSF